MMTDKILIIEDDAHLREWLTYELETAGYHTTSAADGLTGLQAAQDQPNLILLDVQLPGMDGFEICRTLQNDPKTAGSPIIFLTAHTTLNDKLSGFDAGGADYMTKPLTMAELKARVKTVLRRREIEQQRAQASLEQYKKHLSQNMSHELLTPMTIILSALDVMDHTVAEKNVSVEVFVRDKGIGIEPDQHERIFDKFYQVDMSITRPVEGMGLGLYIARTLTRAYGGDVTVASEPGQGATFCFSLPDVALDWAEGEKNDYRS